MLPIELTACGWGEWGNGEEFNKHTLEQIVRKLDAACVLKKSRAATARILTELWISETTLNRWQATHGSKTKSDAKELQRLHDENARLKRLLAHAEREKADWKEVSEGSF
ncbi:MULTISPECIES: hypothetical protein [Corynebacterium]|uniref:hypothetical protein n=1 Tax=Corynebacterium TaxID=1716 RepID=UPI0009F65972|nr:MULTISPECIES: hypothetical protein [Corynebacterium]WJY72557.1 hypothetical protein CAURIC_04550 [Corynebacterium auriscanis]